MDIISSIRVSHRQFLIHYTTLVEEPTSKEIYLKSNHRYIGIELGIANFPANAMVFDFCHLKLAINKLIAGFKGKTVLCARSQLYSLVPLRQNVLVTTANTKTFECSRKDCIIEDLQEMTDEALSRIVYNYMVSNIFIPLELERPAVLQIYISKMKSNGNVKKAAFNVLV